MHIKSKLKLTTLPPGCSDSIMSLHYYFACVDLYVCLHVFCFLSFYNVQNVFCTFTSEIKDYLLLYNFTCMCLHLYHSNRSRKSLYSYVKAVVPTNTVEWMFSTDSRWHSHGVGSGGSGRSKDAALLPLRGLREHGEPNGEQRLACMHPLQ